MNFSKPTKPSSASRFPALKSRGSCRGFAVHDDKCYVFESHLELMVLYKLLLLPAIIRIEDQPPPVTYQDESGRSRRHTFDFRVHLDTGARIFVAVKPFAKLERSGLSSIVKLISAQIAPALAGKIVIITDQHFSRNERHNIILAQDCNRFPIQEHDEIARRIAGTVVGYCSIQELVDMTSLGGMGFRSIVRLLTSGFLSLGDPGSRITLQSKVFVRRNGGAATNGPPSASEL